MSPSLRPLVTAFGIALAVAASAVAQSPPCRPCIGLLSDDPAAVAAALERSVPLEPDARLYVSWTVRAGADDPVADASRMAAAGAVPWLRLLLETPAPPIEHTDRLADELAALASIAARAPGGTHFQLEWRPGGSTGTTDPRATAFVLKRAAVAVAGAAPSAKVIAGGLLADPDWLATLYAEDLGAYIDGAAFAAPRDASGAARIVAEMTRVDPGRPLVLEGATAETAADAVLRAADDASHGIAVTLVRIPQAALEGLGSLVTAARELAGDLAYDPSTSPPGGWSFVRGSDLALRIVAASPSDGGPLILRLPDPALRDPVLVAPDGTTRRLQVRRSGNAVEVAIDNPPPLALVRVERMSAAELGGFSAETGVEGARTVPVEEILSRLQASEDAQARRLDHYEATFTTHLRFRAAEGTQPIEATFSGPLVSRADGGFDWAWENLRINGVEWRGKIPELPLIQPEKAAALPIDIHFTPEYRYRLRGTETVADRDCWAVEFEPIEAVPGRSLYRGTVWIDRAASVRVRTRSLQVGLSGDVLSNEETVDFAPVDVEGRRVDWSREAFILPVRTTGHELQSILNTVVLVEKESVLSDIRINRPGVEDRLASLHASNRTMVRDTPGGLRYLEPTDDGARRVKDTDDPGRLFVLAGTYFDESLDFPLPLGGVNWFTRDLAGSGLQANVFFAGAFVNANIAEPSLFGSRWDAGARLFGFFVPFEEKQFSDGVEVAEETLEHRPARAALFLGRPLGAYSKIDLTYAVDWDEYGRADDTADAFDTPADTFTHSLGLGWTWSRSGLTVAFTGAASRRDRWTPWGADPFAGYDPTHRDFVRWDASVSKSWWLGGFTRLGVELEHLDGSDLDRFSSYDFSFFSGSRVAGFPSGLVTATEADGVHISYGFNLADVIRLEGRADTVWATDARTGLDRERLAGLGVSGSLVGPWQTLVTFDVGVAVDGPADSVSASVVVLKLFD